MKAQNYLKYWYTFLIDGGEINYSQSVQANNYPDALAAVNKCVGVYGDTAIKLLETNDQKHDK